MAFDKPMGRPIRIMRERPSISLVANFKIVTRSHGRFAFVTYFEDLCVVYDFRTRKTEFEVREVNDRLIENLGDVKRAPVSRISAERAEGQQDLL